MKKSCTTVPTANLMPIVMKRAAVRKKNLKQAHVVMVMNEARVVVADKARVVVADKARVVVADEAWVVVADEARVMVAAQHHADSERMLQTGRSATAFLSRCLPLLWKILDLSTQRLNQNTWSTYLSLLM